MAESMAVSDHPPFLYRDYRSTIKRSPQKDLVAVVRTLSETTGPGLNSAPVHSRHRMISRYDHGLTTERWALGYRFDVVVRGPEATPFEDSSRTTG